MSNERKYYEHLVGIMLTTRGVRFSVAESERRKERFSIATVAALSVYLAGWSMAASFLPELFSPFQSSALSFLSVIASVALLVISLFDFAAGRSVYSEKMLQNAFAITVLLREAERELAKDLPDYVRLADLASEYESVVTSAGVNHTSKDYKLWTLQRVKTESFLHAFETWVHMKFLRLSGFAAAMAFQIFLLLIISAATVGIIYYP